MGSISIILFSRSKVLSIFFELVIFKFYRFVYSCFIRVKFLMIMLSIAAFNMQCNFWIFKHNSSSGKHALLYYLNYLVKSNEVTVICSSVVIFRAVNQFDSYQ